MELLILAAVLSCPVEIACAAGPGTCEVEAVVWYAHEAMSGDKYYWYETTSLVVPSTPGMMYVVDAAPEGAPVGIVWGQKGSSAIVRQCGINPTEVFRDGFESGNVSAWR
jgi:hypothetical protein